MAAITRMFDGNNDLYFESHVLASGAIPFVFRVTRITNTSKHRVIIE